MHKKGLSFWDTLAWIILGLILIWVILKVSGILSTPNLLEYAPYFGIVYLAGWAMHKLERATEDIRDFKNFNKETANQINNIKTNCIKNHPKTSAKFFS